MSLEAEERVNASTINSNSTVEQSALTRDRVEDFILEQESQFREKQEEQARLLDELAGKLQSLDLSAAAEMVRFEFGPQAAMLQEQKYPALSLTLSTLQMSQREGNQSLAHSGVSVTKPD